MWGTVDFEALLDEEELQPIEPRELYEQLNKKPGYGYLRDVQAQVLTAWHERRDERDLVIKVNTGGGKTIDGLVILQSYLNEGLGPALYVAPSKYLVKRVMQEAENLNIETVTDPDDPRYLSGAAIAVVNADKLFNGKTVFSDRRSPATTAPIGAVVIDDAHAAVETTRQKLALKIQRPKIDDADAAPLFDDLLNLFRGDIAEQYPDGILDVEERVPGALVRVPFWSWTRKTDQARALLREHAKNGQELYYAWPAVRDVLHLCRVVFTDRDATITPPCPPIAHVSSFKDAKRRVYLSATLADDSVLVTDFAADSEAIAQAIHPRTAGDIGERMILAPQEINPGIRPEAVRREIENLSKTYNTVVLVPSNAAMKEWPGADRTASADDIESVVEELKSGKHVGLVVLANKYDGIDLPQDACRILVIDGLPMASTGEDRLESQLSSQELGIDARQVQRIEQGMGRGVRSNEDHCVVFLLGPKLSQLTSDPRSLNMFSPATREQLRLSRTVARRMDNMPLSKIIEVAQQALGRDKAWVAVAKKQLRNILPEPARVVPSAVARRRAFEAAAEGDYTKAAELLQDAVGKASSSKEQGWLLEQRAVYLDQTDPVLAQVVLAQAREKNSWATRPINGVSYIRLQSVDYQAKKASENVGGMYGNAPSLRLGIEALVDDLQFDSLRVEEFEQGILELGRLLGLGSQRPESEMGQGSDNLWALGDGHYWVIECKSGATSDKIGKRDVAQLAHSMNWFRSRYGEDANAVPVMVHPASQLFKDATLIPGMQVLTPGNLQRLLVALRSYADGLASTTQWTNAADVQRLLEGHNLAAAQLGTYLLPARQAR